MSSLSESVGINDKINIKPIDVAENNNNCYSRHVLKSNNNVKPKCNKALKRKLRKYKLRKDGKEDQDILDVSQTFLSTLKIKSPTNQLKSPNNCSESEERRPKNYLFKMARRKQKVKPEGADEIPKQHTETDNTLNGSQTKKQTNAFKFMMDSRNKSIGSNSPGKEKNIDECEMQEFIDKKKLKVKRNLALQKMAEAKGSLKKKEMEDYQEKCVKQKMEERAEKLKIMITKNKKEKRKVSGHAKIDMTLNKLMVKEAQHTRKDVDDLDADNDKKDTTKQSKTLQLVDIFCDNDNINLSRDVKPKKKPLTNDDEEFFKKLSPSIRKKENMLCYFKKLEKGSESCVNVEYDIPGNNNPVIKVKMTSKSRKKSNKLSLNKEVPNDILKNDNEIHCNATDIETISIVSVSRDTKCAHRNSERKKRKRPENTLEVNSVAYDTAETTNAKETKEKRPKREVKKPVKYLDDVQLSSSDEELHIFATKKRKQIENKTKHTTKVTSDTVMNISDEDSQKGPSNHRKISSEVKTQKKSIKLAPIFAAKTHLTPEEIEAKLKFLHSGIPEQLKKIIGQQRKDIAEIYNIFPTVIHVQQKVPSATDMCMHSIINLPDNDSEDEICVQEENLFSKLLTLTKAEITCDIIPKNKRDVHVTLQNIKEIYPKFPVYRTYRLLKGKSKGELKDCGCTDFDNSIEVVNGMVDGVNIDSLTWIDKYKATSTKHLIGNFESIKELRKWLVSWTENQISRKNNVATDGSDSSDFYESDTDSRDSLRTTNSLLVISGPVGSGKTSSVYAVAAELAIKVIEVNASSKRTGKVMIQDLHEATQSHKVNRVNGSTENSQKSQEVRDPFVLKTVKKRGRPKKESDKLSQKNTSTRKNEMLSHPSASQEGIRTGMSLILIDDADIVFEQDDGFSSGVAQLVQSSKRPVILVTSSLTCPHLQRFLQCGRIMKMRPLIPKMLGTWLDIMCLADNGTCWPGLGAKFLDFFKGDIRKTINSLQFYMATPTKVNTTPNEDAAQNCDSYGSNIDDENSSMSWADNECLDEKSLTPRTFVSLDGVWNHFMGNQTNLMLLKFPFELFNVWWNIPYLLRETCNDKLPEQASNSEKSNNYKKEMNELEVFADALDTLSVADCMGQPDNTFNSTSEPWRSFESDSVSELENLDHFHRSHEICDEITHNLVTSSVVNAQRILQIEHKTDIHFPGIAVQRDRDKLISRHNSLTSCLNPAAVLDRRALALDYWSSCRTICRIEKTKTDTTSKRNNRFCHYLKSLNVLCKNDSYDKLGDSLCCRGKNN